MPNSFPLLHELLPLYRLLIINALLLHHFYAVRMGGTRTDEKAQLGARIRRLRKGQGLSQRTLALMIGMDRTYLVAVEHGRYNIALDNIAKIASGLGVSLSELFEGVEINPPQQAKRIEYNVVNANAEQEP